MPKRVSNPKAGEFEQSPRGTRIIAFITEAGGTGEAGTSNTVRAAVA